MNSLGVLSNIKGSVLFIKRDQILKYKFLLFVEKDYNFTTDLMMNNSASDSGK